jgi:hypothetical protein
LTMISLNRFSCRMRLLQPQMGTPAQSIHRNRRRRIDMKKAMMITLSAVTMIMAVGNARAEMPTDAKKTAYFVGKAASQLPPGYVTEEFPPEAGNSHRVRYSILSRGLHPDRTGSGEVLSNAQKIVTRKAWSDYEGISAYVCRGA